MQSGNNVERRKNARQKTSTQGELYLESTAFKAMLVNFSDGGVRLTMESPINFTVRFKVGEKRINRRVQLVWSNKNEEGNMRYGFNYLDNPE